MSSVESSDVARRLMEEKPKIDRAMKNYMSILMARERSSERTKVTTTAFLLQSARLVMSRIKQVHLVSPIEYGKLCPQKKDQTALDRMDEISNYKIYFALYQKIKANEKASPNRLFGRSYIQFLLKNPILKFKEAVLNDAKKRFDGDDEKFELFEEFFCGFIGVDSMKTLLLGEYSKLVWSENFEDELRHIQKRRKKQREEENVKRVTSELIESTK